MKKLEYTHIILTSAGRIYADLPEAKEAKKLYGFPYIKNQPSKNN